jgi:hypothetical protein
LQSELQRHLFNYTSSCYRLVAVLEASLSPLAVLQAWWGFESPPDHSGLPVTSWYALKTVIKGRRLLAGA